jgi:hypothetical protein
MEVSEAQTDEAGVLENFGLSIEQRIQDEMGASLTDLNPEVKEIRNLAGDNTGYMRIYTADKLLKACFMSVNVMPGARYFNIHIHPLVNYRIPRFSFEGMMMAHGSQVSMDLYPDMDLLMRIDDWQETCGAVTPIYDEAKQSELNIQPSRLMHMRAFASPFFINSVNTSIEQLPQVEAIANRYFDEWLKVYRSAPEVDAAEAAERQQRREQFAQKIIELDPDRQMIVQVYGEETTLAIENAIML